MKFELTITRSDNKSLVKSATFNWRIQTDPSGGALRDSGTADADDNGVVRFESTLIEARDYLLLSSGELQTTFQVFFIKPSLKKNVEVEKVVSASQKGSQFKELSAQYDITANNTTDWDWLTWETEGNSDPKYQRGGKERKLGLYRLNYDLLRKAGGREWAEAHRDETMGGGWVKIAILDECDYNEHKALMSTFLPCFSIQDGKLIAPSERELLGKQAKVSRSLFSSKSINVLDTPPPFIVMPFNYDDNSGNSKAIGKSLSADPLGNTEAKRLTLELPRWATASRSTITSFAPNKPDLTPHTETQWSLRPSTANDPTLTQVKGNPSAKTFRQYQEDGSNKDKRFYSVKTGVDYVSTQEQGTNGKDKLESNSIHAMSRSNLIAGMLKRAGLGSFEARYQIEILSILLGKEGSWDGIQIREIGGAGSGEIWFPALAIPSHGKPFAEAWKSGCNWIEFWEEHFARPLGRAKAEMMAYFGLQHMTSNAQNFLIAFDRNSPGTKAKHVILRDIGDTILHTAFFDVLTVIDPKLFKTTWKNEVADDENGIVLKQGTELKDLKIGGGYSNPQITRIGTGIVFFFKPFLKGELDTEKDPAKAKIIARWCLAHNNGFLDYMKERIGYTETWSGGTDSIDPSIKASIWKNADLSLSGQTMDYAKAADDVIKLSATTRQRLIREIKSEIESLTPASKEDVDKLQRLIAGHELLICAEIHNYIQSPIGKTALADLHKHGAKTVVSTASVSSGPTCYVCKTPMPSTTKGWFKCGACQSLFCVNCGKSLKYPPGTSKAMERITEDRRCGNEICKGFATPMP